MSGPWYSGDHNYGITPPYTERASDAGSDEGKVCNCKECRRARALEQSHRQPGDDDRDNYLMLHGAGM